MFSKSVEENILILNMKNWLNDIIQKHKELELN